MQWVKDWDKNFMKISKSILATTRAKFEESLSFYFIKNPKSTKKQLKKNNILWEEHYKKEKNNWTDILITMFLKICKKISPSMLISIGCTNKKAIGREWYLQKINKKLMKTPTEKRPDSNLFLILILSWIKKSSSQRESLQFNL